MSSPDEITVLQKNLSNAIQKASRPTCDSIYFNLREHADPEFRQTKTYDALIKTLSLSIDLEDSSVFGTIELNSFTEEECHLLYHIRLSVTNPEIRARLCDVLWLKKQPSNVKHFELGLEACHYYFLSAQSMENHVNLLDAKKRLERALVLGYNFRKLPQNPLEPIIKHVKAVIDNPPQPNFIRHYLSLICSRKFLDEQEVGKYVRFTEEKAKSHLENEDWLAAQSYWKKHRAFLKLKPEDTKSQQIQASKNESEVDVQHAFARAKAHEYGEAASLLAKGIKGLRSFGEDEARVNRLHAQLIEYQDKSKSQSVSFHVGDYDITDSVFARINEVQNKSFPDAIYALIQMFQPLSEEMLLHKAKQLIEKYDYHQLFSILYTNDRGRFERRTSPYKIGGSEEENNNVLQVSKNHEARFIVGCQGSTISGAIEHIALEHPVGIEDWDFIVNRSPFVPPGKELIFAKGFQAGLRGDFMTAAHLLIPQVESSIRSLLEQAGVAASKLLDSELQQERSLEQLLEIPVLKEIFSNSGLLYTIRFVFSDRANLGLNLRNELAHGLISDDRFQGSDFIYAWWLILCLVGRPIMVQVLNARDYQEIAHIKPFLATRAAGKKKISLKVFNIVTKREIRLYYFTVFQTDLKDEQLTDEVIRQFSARKAEWSLPQYAPKALTDPKIHFVDYHQATPQNGKRNREIIQECLRQKRFIVTPL